MIEEEKRLFRKSALKRRAKITNRQEKSAQIAKNLFLVPGCAFTRDGLRMGYGGGYYDRYLQMYKEAVTVGYAFEEQLFDAIPSEAHDRRLDFVVTQKDCYEAEYSRM